MAARSGLKAITRDFTDSSDSEVFYPWPQSSQIRMGTFNDAKNATSFSRVNSESKISASSQVSERGRAARLAAIEAAYRETRDDGPVKRPSPTEDIPGPAKRRKSDDDYYEPDAAVPNANQTTSISNPPAKTPAKIFLSAEQRHILQLVTKGDSVFYTGSAGTGKSVLLREIITTLKKKYTSSSDAIAITASTGIAACNIGGMTIHSFAGIGLGNESAEQLCTKVKKNKKAMGRWQRTKVLIIDEGECTHVFWVAHVNKSSVSMVDGNLFDKLAQISCSLRRNPKPFGGIQVCVQHSALCRD